MNGKISMQPPSGVSAPPKTLPEAPSVQFKAG